MGRISRGENLRMVLESTSPLQVHGAPLHTLHDFKGKEDPSISRANQLNQLGWDFLKWQVISACIVLSYLDMNSFLPLLPQCDASPRHKPRKLFAAGMLALGGARTARPGSVGQSGFHSLPLLRCTCVISFFHISFLIFLL